MSHYTLTVVGGFVPIMRKAVKRPSIRDFSQGLAKRSQERKAKHSNRLRQIGRCNLRACTSASFSCWAKVRALPKEVADAVFLVGLVGIGGFTPQHRDRQGPEVRTPVRCVRETDSLRQCLGQKDGLPDIVTAPKHAKVVSMTR
ncbi:hypothetical protein GQF56_01835 [Rhodobacter sphaeroides]|uniref:Uncharacterized protein n=1 Tax=Cereibacter sphaeroides (strain ATCC 17023 / DSM 158 / JCM 6121 / CCUG 31486 / LMG 2827 / NBRC 12203 / NCIMB 8253 / ATH 2.4.1.) TaxID=272943 RepID=Q3IYW4_CERS4|nr:hypothetical protein RSP_6231 [Cereibacter sphaeroides 2.4.1]AXC62872.1 hypothetical protein DQL45_14160 [Cereibacter sphaeroides 2.4.1]MVX46615.1 hypothetical protein [Cereibacter sphaeroides]